MDMQFLTNERVARIAKVIALVVVVVFVIAIVLTVIENRVNFRQNGMMPIGSFQNDVIQSGSGMMGTGVVSPMAGYLDARGIASKDVAVSDSASVQNENVPAVDKKIIKTGDLTLKVESVEKTMDNLRWVAGQFGGDIFSSSIYDATGNNVNKSGVVTIKVPAEHFDEAMQSIKSAARVVVRETTSGQDVSSEYVDLQARLKNKQAEEESIAAILTRDTNKITDVLEVTTELARVRGEIEQLQAQIKYLDNQSDMSTITVSFTEDAQIGNTDTKWRPSQEIKDAVNALIKTGQKVVSFLISFIIVLLPILLILLLVFGGILYVIVKKLRQWLN